MNLKPISDYIEADGLGVFGSTLFVNSMPIGCKKGILLKSPLSGTRFDHELPGYFRGEFALIIRAPKYLDGLALIEAVTTLLTFKETQLQGMYVNYVRPKTLPVSFPVSEGDAIEFTADFETVFVI